MGGRGRGQGRGRGGRPNSSNDDASNAATIRELTQATKDIQKVLGDCELFFIFLSCLQIQYSW